MFRGHSVSGGQCSGGMSSVGLLHNNGGIQGRYVSERRQKKDTSMVRVPWAPFEKMDDSETPPPHRSGIQMLNADLHAARRKAAKHQSQNKRLFSDIAMGAFRCDTGNPPGHSCSMPRAAPYLSMFHGK